MSERQTDELKARYVDLENKSDEQSKTIKELKESLACCDEKVKSLAEHKEENDTPTADRTPPSRFN